MSTTIDVAANCPIHLWYYDITSGVEHRFSVAAFLLPSNRVFFCSIR